MRRGDYRIEDFVIPSSWWMESEPGSRARCFVAGCGDLVVGRLSRCVSDRPSKHWSRHCWSDEFMRLYDVLRVCRHNHSGSSASPDRKAVHLRDHLRAAGDGTGSRHRCRNAWRLGGKAVISRNEGLPHPIKIQPKSCQSDNRYSAKSFLAASLIPLFVY